MSQLTKEQLERLKECYAVAVDLLNQGSFPGHMAGAVYSSIVFLRANFDDIENQIKRLEPDDKKPESTEPIQEQAK